MIRKPFLLIMCLLSSAVSAQPLPRSQLEAQDGAFRDLEYGLEIRLPAGFRVMDGARWGELETTLFLSAAKSGHVFVVNYQLVPEGIPEAEVFKGLAAEFHRKELERRNDSRFPGYAPRDGSTQQRTIHGAATLSWIADYLKDGAAWCELFTLVAGRNIRVSLFVAVPVGLLAEVKPPYEALLSSITLGTPSLLASLDPDIVEARRLFKDGRYQEATNAFRKELSSRAVEGHELVAAAAAAAAAGEKSSAMEWMRAAVERGWTVTNRVQWDPRFTSLHDDEEWKAIVNALGPAPGPGSSTIDKALQAQLLQILEDDQQYRALIKETEQKHGSGSSEMKALWDNIAKQDRINLSKVEHILQTKGWVGPNVVGEKASDAIFLVIQHADPSTQKRYLPMMRDAVERRQASASSLALLEDRVALFETGFQIYGTQIQRDAATGTYTLLPLKDPAGVDARRSAVGLPPIASYLRRWNIEWDSEQYRARPSGPFHPN